MDVESFSIRGFRRAIAPTDAVAPCVGVKRRGDLESAQDDESDAVSAKPPLEEDRRIGDC